MDDDELTIEEMILVQRCAIEAIVETLKHDSPPLFFQIKDRLAVLFEQVRRGEIQPEYAEVQFDRILDEWAKWQRENQIPPN